MDDSSMIVWLYGEDVLAMDPQSSRYGREDDAVGVFPAGVMYLKTI